MACLLVIWEKSLLVGQLGDSRADLCYLGRVSGKTRKIAYKFYVTGSRKREHGVMGCYICMPTPSGIADMPAGTKEWKDVPQCLHTGFQLVQ